MKTVDEAVEDDVGDVAGVVRVDAQRREDLIFLPRDFLGRKRRVTCDVGDEIHPGLERILHHDDVHERQVGGRARSQVAADEVDLIRDLLCVARGRPLVEQRRRQVRDASFSFWILR